MSPGANESVIRVVGLGKSYETAAGLFPALKGVNLDIKSGEYIAIMGPSGSGKSTFMNLLGCLDTPSTGDYFLAGRNVAHGGPRRANCSARLASASTPNRCPTGFRAVSNNALPSPGRWSMRRA